MAIEGIPDYLHERLQLLATEHGRSMDEDLRLALEHYAFDQQPDKPGMMGTRIHERFADVGGWNIELPPREDLPREVDFGE